jgi:tetratricopeptide (TPR) repeat protein
MTEPDVSQRPESDSLFAAWQATGQRREEILAGIRVPGAIALRSRYRHLLDPEAPPGPWDAGCSRQHWRSVIRLETQGDEAVHRNDFTAARAAFTELAGLETEPVHQVITVHAHLGLGDIELGGDNAEAAAREYETALTLAGTSRYRFGQLRALVGLGYITLIFHSAGAARDLFTRAFTLARQLADPVYAGNAALGAAECAERLGELEQAVTLAGDAYESFSAVGSPLGEGNAAQRLGSMLHRLGRRDEARGWLERALAAFASAGNPTGITNTLSGLGDLLLDAGDTDEAERAYRRSLETAESAGLRRSRAHALQDLARVERSRGDWAAAARAFTRALEAYRELDELLGMSHAFDKLAEAYAQAGSGTEVMRVRLEAVFAIEEYRATHRDERSQREYRDRFARTYAAALDAASAGDSAESFAVVADCLAGRRLAGLFAETARAAGTGELALLQELLVRADQRLVARRHEEAPLAAGDAGAADDAAGARGRRDRLIRTLGAVGIKHGLAPRAEISLDDLLAAVYLPPADEGGLLLQALPENCHALQILLDPQDPGRARWLWQRPDRTTKAGGSVLTSAAADLIAVLRSDSDDRAGLRISDMAPLSDLLPAELRAELAAGRVQRLVILPVGELWLVPWGAVPVAPDRVLGEAASYVICPSLTIQRQLATRGAPGLLAHPQRADLWRSPLISHHELTRFQADQAWQVSVLRTSDEAKERLRAGGHVMVVAGHGRPAPGLGHYLELDRGQWLLPVDLIGASPPRRLAVIACWGGAIPGAGPSDPLSLATLALAAGSSEILATVGELGDSAAASVYVEKVLSAMATRALPDALRAATTWILQDMDGRAELIHHWAPLVPIGTFYG